MRARAPQESEQPPTPEQHAWDAADRAAKWGKVALTLFGIVGTVLTFLATTGAAILDMPDRMDRHEARADTLAATIRTIQNERQRDRQEDRAQTCALKQMAREADPAGCFEFLPDPAYYDPPVRP